jgi:hypothetical protein
MSVPYATRTYTMALGARTGTVAKAMTKCNRDKTWGASFEQSLPED